MQYLANRHGLSIAIGPPKLNLEPLEHRHTEPVCKIGSRSRRLLMVGAELTKILHLSEPEEAMATNPTEFPRLNAELATEATDVSLNWFRPIAEQNLKQSCGSLQELLKVTRRMIGEFDNQASAFCEHSISLAEETIANTFEWCQTAARERAARTSANSN